MPSTRPTVDPVLDILEELGYDFDELDGDGYKRSIREAIFRTHPDTGGKTADPEKFQILNEEFKRIRRGGKKPVEFKEKKTTIKATKLLPGTATTKPDDLKQAQIDESGEDKSKLLQPDILNDIAKSVESIATLLKRQLGVEKKQQRDAKIKQDKDNKAAREDKLEGKPKDKKTGLIPKSIAKPAIGFFGKIKDFFLNIGIGAALYKMHAWMTDPANTEKIGKFTDFLIKHAPLILGGLAALALLPVVGGLVGMIGGIMGGLAMLGLAVPLLPIILKGMLIAAVIALTVATANVISKGITGGKVIGGERKENKDRLRAAGIQDATKNKLTLLDPKTGTGRMKVKYWGENSISGREFNPWNPTHLGPEDKEVELDLMKPKHAEWYVKNYGQAALDEKLAAYSSFRETKTSLVKIKEDKQLAITKARGEWYNEFEKEGKELGFDTDGSDNVFGMAIDFFRKSKKQKEWEKKKNAEWQKIKLSIEEEADKKAIKIGDQAVIDKDVKPNTDVPGPSNKNNKGNVVVVGGGGGGDQNQAITGGGSDSSGTPYFGGRNLDTFNTADLYNLQTK